MTVKSKRGRRRYIAFVLSPSMTKNMLSSSLNDNLYVVQCSHGWCVVRYILNTIERDDVINSVKSVDPTATPLRTSGTLKTLRDRYPMLEKYRSPPRR